MAKSLANVNIATDTFVGLVNLTNLIADTITNEAATFNSTTVGANTSGNGNITGILTATTIGTNTIRGGTASAANIATIAVGLANSTTSSNVVINGYTANVSANNLNITSNSTVNASALTINVSSIGVYGNTTIGSNSSHSLILSGVNTFINSTALSITSNASLTGANININSANITLTGGILNISSNVNFANTIVSSSLDVQSNTNFTGSNNFFQNQITANTIVIASNTYVNSAVIFSGNTAAIIQSSSNFTFPGDGTTSNIVNSFEFSEFGSAKYTVNVVDNDNSNNRLITEISAVYDYNGTINSTEYGTIFTDTRFMTFALSSNSTHIRLVGVSNSSVTNTKVTIVRTSFL